MLRDWLAGFRFVTGETPETVMQVRPRHVGRVGWFPHWPLAPWYCPFCVGARRWFRSHGVHWPP